MIYSLKSRQICLFFIAFLPVTKFFLMPSIVSSYSLEDTWISLVLNLAIDFITIFLLVKLTKDEKRNFFQILEDWIGKIPCKIVLILYLIYFMIKAIMPISEQIDYVTFTLYMTTTSKIFFIPFFVIPIYLSTKKLRVIGRCADAVWLFAVIGYILIFALSIGNVDLGAILPIGKAGAKNVAMGSFSVLNWFGDCAYFIFFIGNYKNEKNDNKKIILSYALSLFIVLIFGFTFWCSFSSIAFRQRFALTEISKYMTVINNIGRFDYFAIFFLLFCGAISVSLPVFFSSILFNRIFDIKKTYIAPILLTAVIIYVTIFLADYFASIESIITTKLGVVFFIFGNVLPIIIAFFSKLSRGKNYEIQEN